MRDHELRTLLNLVDEPTEPPGEYVEALWEDLEAELSGHEPGDGETQPRPRVRAYLAIVASLMAVLGVAGVLAVAGGPDNEGTVAAEPDAENPACGLFAAGGDLRVLWQSGVVTAPGASGSGSSVESDASAAQLTGSAQAVDELADRVASSEGPQRLIVGELERVALDLDRASLLVRFDERRLAQEAIERARAAIVGMAFEPGLNDCLDTDAWSG